MQNRKVIVVLIVAVLLTSFLTYVMASSPSTTLTISSGLYPGAVAFTVYEIDGTVYAKDQNGYIEYSGTSSSNVINDAIEATPYYGTVVLATEITLDDSILIEQHPVNLEFGKIIIDEDMTTSGIMVKDVSYFATNPAVSTRQEGGINIKGNYIAVLADELTWDAAAIYVENATSVYIDVTKLQYLPSGQQSGTGIEFYAGDNQYIMGCTIANIQRCSYFETGIYWHNDGSGYINQNMILNSWVGSYSTYCLRLYNEGNGIGGNIFDGFRADNPDTTVGYCIWIESAGDAEYEYVEKNVFSNYLSWDVSGSAIDYHADASVNQTMFVGSRVRIVPDFATATFGSRWDDSGCNTAYVGCFADEGRPFSMPLGLILFPSPPEEIYEGEVWYNATSHTLEYYNGSDIVSFP